MFLSITLFEIKLGLRKISFWVYCLIFFAIAFLIVNVLGGAFTGVSAVMDNTKWNAPEAIAGFQASFTILGTVICAALFGNAAYKDFENKMDPLIFTKPIRPHFYFLGRFSGALFLNICIHIFFSLGLFIAFLMPYLDQDGIGPLRFDAFVQPFVIFVVPNVFFIGSMLFTLAILTKRMLPTYLGSVILLFGYLTAGNLMTDIETRWIASLLDPFGGEAVSESTRYWTPAEKNQLLVPLDGWLLLNRIIWVSFGLIILGVGLNKFDFTHITSKKKNKTEKKSLTLVNPSAIPLPRSSSVFGFSTSVLQLKSKVKISRSSKLRGNYHWDSDTIVIDNNPSDMLDFVETVLHEIDHAVMRKKLGANKYEIQYTKAGQEAVDLGLDFHDNNPFEIQAEKYAEKNGKKWLKKILHFLK